ncbi:phosphonate C-P lyase system protein PhnH [Microbacterium sp.]|uniref:phosphonate C-P lyase system protein PhnH n=1 Tax=Microbacterium sp. TaxID=51671 RepID=UPI003C72C605
MTLIQASGASGPSYLPGFTDAVGDAQRTFRAVLDAMARPMLAQAIPAVQGERPFSAPAPLGAGAGAILLTLCDAQTPIWLDRALRFSKEVESWVRFHTGAPLVDSPTDALFVIASSPSVAPDLHELAQGTDQEPHTSATVLIDATGTGPVGRFAVSGPGVDGEIDWDGVGLNTRLLDQWDANREQFPRGVDIILADETSVRAVPRTTKIERKDA